MKRSDGLEVFLFFVGLYVGIRCDYGVSVVCFRAWTFMAGTARANRTGRM